MATVGALGNIIFTVSARQIKTLSEFKRTRGAKFANHERHMKKPLREYTGPELDGVDFSVTLSAFLGVNPQKELDKLGRHVDSAKVSALVIGERVLGNFTIDSMSENWKKFTARGKLLEASVSLKLTEYTEE